MSKIDYAPTPICVAEHDPRREAHHSVLICTLDGATAVADVYPRYAHLADHIAAAIDQILKREAA